MEHITTDIGSRLRQAREHRGLTLRDIAATTKISMTALVAIEQNDFERLPGGVFRRGYVKAFAAEVGLDADELAREYRARFEPQPAAAQLPQHEADWKTRLRFAQRSPAKLAIIVGSVICALLLWDRRQVLIESDTRDEVGAAEVDIPDDTTETDETDGAAEVAFANAAVSDIHAPLLRLEIRTKSLCWVSAVADGERTVYRLMQPGERTLVEARIGIVLRVGDAGAFAYSINGAPGRPLGRSGEAVTIRLTNDNLESLYAKPGSSFPAGGAHDSTGRRDLEQQWPTGERHGSSPEVQARRVFAESDQAHPSQRAR